MRTGVKRLLLSLCVFEDTIYGAFSWGKEGASMGKEGENVRDMGLCIAYGVPMGVPSLWKSQKIGQGPTESTPHPLEKK